MATFRNKLGNKFCLAGYDINCHQMDGRVSEEIYKSSTVVLEKIKELPRTMSAGTLEHGYLKSAPLPRVPILGQSTLVC